MRLSWVFAAAFASSVLAAGAGAEECAEALEPGHRLASTPATAGSSNTLPWHHPRHYIEPYWTVAENVRRAEIVEMLATLAQGQPPDAGKGWFHEGKSRYGWQWLSERFDEDGDEAISPDEFPDEAADSFARLDRNEDGALKADDFDWSESAPFVKQSAYARRFFSPLDHDRNGRLTRQEWQDFFDKAALGAEALTPDDLRAALFPPEPAKSDDDPSPLGLLKGFLTGELGSMYEGPSLEQRAPDFELADHHGQRRIRLAEVREHKPVVLIFGSFT
ncbi:MAG TPA: hypothetical protein VF306_09630 [Pirellulales bacterium]